LHDGFTSLNQKKPLSLLQLMRCNMKILRELTPEILPMFDADQNILNFNSNGNAASVVYTRQGSPCRASTAKINPGRSDRSTVPASHRGQKKGAQRAPLTPTESLRATARSHHHKTRTEYGYLSPAAH
jgi:hypothetical protein